MDIIQWNITTTGKYKYDKNMEFAFSYDGVVT